MAVKAGTEFVVPLKLKDEISKALKDTSKQAGKATSGFSKMQASVVSLNQALDLASRAYNALSAPVREVINLFEEQEEQETRLKNTLALVNDLTKESFESFKQFSSELQKVSTVGDETSLRMLATAKAMKLTNVQAKELVQASADLSAATGKDLQTSFAQLLKTVGGFAGELGETLPEIKKLTSEQLKAGEGIRLVGKEYQGFAKAATESLRGARKQSENAFGDMKEAAGEFLSTLFDLPNATKDATKFFENMTRVIQQDLIPLAREANEKFSVFFKVLSNVNYSIIISSLKSLTVASAAFVAVWAANDVRKAMNSVGGLQSAIKLMGGSKGILNQLKETFIKFGKGLMGVVGPMALVAGKFIAIVGGAAGAVIAVDLLARNFDLLGPAISRALNAGEITRLQSRIEDLNDLISTGVKSGRGSGPSANGYSTGINKSAEAVQRLKKEQEDLISQLKVLTGERENLKQQFDEKIDFGLAGELKKFITDLVDGFKEAEKSAKKISDNLPENVIPKPTGPEAVKGIDLFDTAQLETIENVMGEAAGGIASAANAMLAIPLAFANVANIILDAITKLLNIIPEILNKIANVFNLITELPIKILEGITNIFSSITGFIENFIPNLLNSILGIVEGLLDFLVDGLPDAFLALGEKIPEFFAKLVARLPEIAFKLGRALISSVPRMAILFVTGIVREMPAIIGELVRSMPEIAEAFVNGVIMGLKELANAIANLFGFDDIFNIGGIEDQIAAMGDNISRAAGDLFQIIDLEAEARGLDVSDRIRDAIASSTSFLAMIWNKLVAALKEAWLWIYNTLLKPFIDLLTKAWSFIYEKILKPIGELGGKIWMGFRDAVSNAASFFGDIGTKIWDGLKQAFGGFHKLIKDQLDKVNPINFFKKIFDDSGAYGKKGDIENALNIDMPFLKFAQGGKVPGQALTTGDSVKNDTVMAMLSPGEYVIPRSLSQKPEVSAMIEQLLRTGGVPGFGLGGFVDKAKKTGGSVSNTFKGGAGSVTSSIKGGLGGIGLNTFWDEVKKKLGEATMKMFEHNAFATGGLPMETMRGHTPAMIDPEEFIVNKEATKNNLPALKRINSSNGPANLGTTIVIQKIEIVGKTDMSLEDVKRRIVPEIKKELRKASEAGQQIIDRKGIKGL